MFELFIEALKVTTGLVLAFLASLFKLLIIIVAAALPLFLVIAVFAGIVTVVLTIISKVRGE